MKNPFIKAFQLALALILLVQVQLLYAQGSVSPAYDWLTSRITGADTVQFRQSASTLGDSSVINYELGQVALISSGSVAYAKFPSTFGSVSSTPTFYKTATIVTRSSSDSISFRRFAWFENRNSLKADITGKDSNFVDSTITSWNSVFPGSYVIPDTAYFNSHSYVLFIVSVNLASNDSTIMNLDTLVCAINASSHKFRYWTSGNTSSFVKVALPTSIGTPIYCTVHRVDSLPSGSTLSTYGYAMNTQSAIPTGLYSYWQRKPPTGSFLPRIAPASVVLGRSNQFTLSVPSNPAFGRIRASIVMDGVDQAPASISLVNSAGTEVWSKSVQLKAGKNDFTVDYGSIQAGDYFLRVSSSENRSIVKIAVIK
jgi:hypothetical protein